MEQNTDTKGAEAHEMFRSLLERNIELSEKIYKQNKKIKRYIVAQTIGSWLRLLLILVPLILAAIYLPPILAPYIEQMRELLETAGNGSKELEEFLKQFSR